MKKLLYILLFVPILVLGQTDTENYILSKTYKQATTTPVVGHDKEKVNTAIQYFDGLGRLKQTIAVEAGGNTISNNNLPIDWTVGNTGSTDFYNSIGTDNENVIINGTTPFGDTDILWECIPDATRNADGGWNSDYTTIDNSKTYRYSIWVKRTGSQNGSTYHGTQNVNNLNGTANGNPYFWAGDLPSLDTWYLLVGITHPYNYSGTDSEVSGVYDINGNKVLDGTEFKWREELSTSRFRSYLFYSTDTNVRQYFWSPLLQEIDGSELSVDDIVTQEVVLVASEQIKDIVTHYEYDELGRQTKEYLPLTHGNGNLEIRTGDIGLATQTYYGQKYAEDFAGVNLPSEINAYSEKAFDNSPLNRVLQQAAPGEDWKLGNGHEIDFDYDTNTLAEVKIYEVTTIVANNTFTPTLTGGTVNYAIGELYKTITKDENHDGSTSKLHTTEEFKNKQGQVILKRTYALVASTVEAHDTFYVYDDYGNLTYVLPPKSEAQTAKPNTTVLDELCYQYIYDHRNRLVEKKIPGKGWEYIVYDKLDRPILTKDLNLVQTKHWLFTKYDKLGRVVVTGKYFNGRTRLTMQPQVDLLSPSQLFETKLLQPTYVDNDIVYYNFASYPIDKTSNTKLYTINYYDNYIADLPLGLSSTITTTYGITSTTNTKGLPTISKVKVLNTDDWITTVSYYDEKARPIYIYSKNDYLNTTDIVESKLDDFTGKVLETRTSHQKTGQDAIVTVDRFEYDHMDRLISQNQQINSQVSNRIVKNNYDDIGQLESKLIGNGTQEGYKDVTTGIAISDNTITKTGANGWNQGLATLGNITGDGYLEYNVGTDTKYFMAGLSTTNLNASYTTIQYAIYNHNKNIYIRESGINKGLKTTYKIGDFFRVERIGNTIYYKKNDVVFYTSLIPSSGSLIGDISIYHNGAQIKDFKIVDNSKGLQKVDYNYNVRGWLKNINKDIANDNDLFNFSLKYNNPQNGANPLFNGNISQTSWNSLSVNTTDNPVASNYNYSYDALNRITSAVSSTNSNYNLWGISYDKNGNIETLKRNGHLDADADTFGGMDNLNYTYDSGNKLVSVTDSFNSTYGFKDGNTSGDDYTYDANGNMISDKNKDIFDIRYNHLNIPREVNMSDEYGSVIEYVYSADGTKLEKYISGGADDVDVRTQYAGNYIYKENELQFFNHPEGYVQTDATGEFGYVYQYKDHLGNVRLSYTDVDNNGIIDPNTEIIEESTYYPFGLKHKGYNNVTSSLGNSTAQKFGYNGKELNEELGLEWHDFGARNYDASLGRWMNLDPLSEAMRRHSPYNYAFNNPIYFIDPDGMAPEGRGEMDEEKNFDFDDSSRGLASTVIDNTGRIIDYKDDGDNNIYLNSRQGKIVGTEREGVTYTPGNRIVNEDLNDGYFIKNNSLWVQLHAPKVQMFELPWYLGGKGGWNIKTIGSYYLRFRVLLSGGVYKVAIQSLGALDEGASIVKLLKALETEAKAAGATKIAIEGVDIYNKKFFEKLKLVEKLGYKVIDVTEETLKIVKKL